jgi:hypothetical protein
MGVKLRRFCDGTRFRYVFYSAKACLGGCGALVNSGSYCSRCQPRNGSTRRWRNTRARVLYRDGWTCQRCGARASHIDHIQPVLFGGTDDETNLQALCTACNLSKGSRPSLRP